MSDGHLYLGCGGVSYTGGSHRAWHDATHQSVLLLLSTSLKILPLDASLDPATSSSENLMTLYDFSKPEASGIHQEAVRQRNMTPIMLLQLSVDGQFLAIQRSDIEVQVLHRATRVSNWMLCLSKAGNKILHGGVIWSRHVAKRSNSQDLFLVTKLGLEHHRMSSKRRSCVLHRIVGLYVHDYWYEASHGVLFLSSGSRANEIVPFLLHGANVETLPKLMFSTSVGKQDLHLVTLYGDVYAIYGNPCTTKLLLYLVGRTKVACVRSLSLMLSPGTALEYSVVDNLLVCHSLDFNVSLFFDIKCDGSTSDPFSAPLPISSRPPGRPLPESKTALAERTVDIWQEFDAAVLKIVSDENHQKASDASMLYASIPPYSIRRALSLDSQDLQISCIDDASLPSPSFQPSPAFQLASQRSARRLQRTTSEASVKKTEATELEAVVPSFSRWRFYAPNFVQRSWSLNGLEQVEIRKLQLNLAEIFKACERHREILPFLLRRGDYDSAKVLVLKLMRKHIVEQQSLSSIVQLLTTVQTMYGNERRAENATSGKALSDSYFVHSNNDANAGQSTDEYSSRPRPTARNVDGFMLIKQTDFYHHVWKNILEDTNISARYNLSVYIVEYIKNLQERKVQVENITYIALAECFIATGQPNKLYQFLHYHVIADSVELAELMVRKGEIYPVLMQLGLDMYYRLKEICPLLHTLLDLGSTEQAIKIAWRNMGSTSCDASVLPGVAFFDSLVRSVTAAKQPRSPFQVTQMLVNLLLFLRVWDPAALECSSTTSLSSLASGATVPFPDEMIVLNSRLKLREAFGFK
ncbi:unnamed protein product [Peronospora destructor]|uniref:Mic1 domain-containing protein n=1 Tax=Peronospora destructor TaxID=86335 RepID=A0AAV0VAS2_9STRA|nr:unnamed protein product [Peronospora destructor]